MQNNNNSNFYNNKDRFKNQANPTHGTQQFNRPSSRNDVQAIYMIDESGKRVRVPMTETIIETDAYGRITRYHSDTFVYDAYGNFIHFSQIVGVSWTGQYVPRGHEDYCTNPFRDHGPRMINLTVDGFYTELGTPVCRQCAEKNESRIDWKKWTILYRPKTV